MILKFHGLVYPRKLTWHWKIPMFNKECIFFMVDFPASHVSFRGGNPKKSRGKMSSLMKNPNDQASHLRNNHISVFLFRLNGLFPGKRVRWRRARFFLVEHKSSEVKVGSVDLVLISLIPSISPPPPFYCVLLPVNWSLWLLHPWVNYREIYFKLRPKKNVFISNMFKFPSKRFKHHFKSSSPQKQEILGIKNWSPSLGISLT